MVTAIHFYAVAVMPACCFVETEAFDLVEGLALELGCFFFWFFICTSLHFHSVFCALLFNQTDGFFIGAMRAQECKDIF